MKFIKNLFKLEDNQIRHTPTGRVIFGFEVKLSYEPDRFLNASYVQAIINQESVAERQYAKCFLWLLIINSLSLFFVEGIKVNYKLFGSVSISEIPSITHVVCLFFGLSLMAYVISTINILLLGRMKWMLIYNLSHTDLINQEIAHLKANSLWADILIPRFIGYTSGRAQSAISTMFSFVVTSFIIVVMALSLWSLFAIFIYGYREDYSLWSVVLSGTGLALGTMSVLFFLISQFIPFKFTIMDPKKQSEQAKDVLLNEDNDSK